MKTVTHEMKARAIDVTERRERAPYSRAITETTTVTMALLDGGRATVDLTGSAGQWEQCVANKLEMRLTLAIDVPDRVDILEQILAKEGAAAALAYARKELAK